MRLDTEPMFYLRQMCWDRRADNSYSVIRLQKQQGRMVDMGYMRGKWIKSDTVSTLTHGLNVYHH